MVRRRSRGVILNDTGWKKLKRKLEELVQSGELNDKSSKAIMIFGSRHAQPQQELSTSTVSQILKRRTVEQTSLEYLFRWFDLTLHEKDYIQPQPESKPQVPQPDEHSSSQVPQPDKDSSIPNYIPFSGTTNFVGRNKLLTELHSTLQQHRLVALAGMGGIGKTETSIQYASRYIQDYPGGVCWIFARQIDAPSNATIAAQIISFATVQLGIKIPDTILEADARLQHCWQNWPKGKVLLIYDDIDHYSDIAPHYLPNDERFRILITTRLQLGSPVCRFPVDILDRNDSLTLLLSFGEQEHSQENADELCDFLGDLPLGVELAGHYLASDPNLSIPELLDELRKRQVRRQAVRHYAFSGDSQTEPAWTLTARRGLEAAFDLTWEKLNIPAQLLAKMIGRFEPGPIRWRTVDMMSQVMAEEYSDVEYDPEGMEQARLYLMKYSLLKPFDDRTYRLHPLSREFFRGKTTDEEDAQYGSAI